MMYFALPGLWENYSVIIPFLSLLQNEPQYFYDDININAVYGNFQFCTWDGGRIFPTQSHATKEDIELLKDIYNNYFHIPMRLIFTNTLIQPNDCYDRFNNLVLSLCTDEINEIVVNSPILEEYLRTNYSQYSFISSTTKCLTQVDALMSELHKNYKFICWDYNLNKNKNALEAVPEELRPKCEFLINAICPPGCPTRKRHYDLNSMFSLAYGKHYQLTGCGIKACTVGITNYKNNFTREELVEYANNGFNHFKLEGRTLPPIEVILNFVKYMVKPEYIFAVIYYLDMWQRSFDLYNFNINTYKLPK